MKSVVSKDGLVYPSKIVCVGRNYVEHIKELNNQIPKELVLFNKPNSAISDKLHFIEGCRFEGEICFMIKNSKIDSIGFGFDLTKVDTQNELKIRGLPWERAKAFDNSAIFSNFVPIRDELSSVEMKLYLNGELKQYANYDLMIYKPLKIIEEIETFMSLVDGDIIMSGTPKGVDFYKRGDQFRAEIYVDKRIVISSNFDVI